MDTVQAASMTPVQIDERGNGPNANEDWRDNIEIPPEYATYRAQFTNMLENYHEIWDGHLRQINKGTSRVELFSPGARQIHAVPYGAGLKARGAERDEVDKMLAITIIEPAQTEWASQIVFIQISTKSNGFT